MGGEIEGFVYWILLFRIYMIMLSLCEYLNKFMIFLFVYLIDNQDYELSIMLDFGFLVIIFFLEINLLDRRYNLKVGREDEEFFQMFFILRNLNLLVYFSLVQISRIEVLCEEYVIFVLFLDNIKVGWK